MIERNRLLPDPKYKGDKEALKTHPFWETLTDIQQRFVLNYIHEGDLINAARATSEYSSDLSAEMSARRHLRNFKIRTLLEEYRGQLEQGPTDKPVTPQELIWLISRRLRSMDTSDGVFATLTSQLIELKKWRVQKRKYTPAGMVERVTKPVAAPEPEEDDEDPFEEVRRLEAARNATT